MSRIVNGIGMTAALAALLLAAIACEPKDETPLGDAELTGLTAELGAGRPDTAALEWGTLHVGDLRPRNPFDLWTFEAFAGDMAFIDLANRDGQDTYLLLYASDDSGRLTLYDYNDDCYSGTLNACLEVELPHTGKWVAVATTYDYLYWRRAPRLEYHITLSCRNASGQCGVEPPAGCGSRGLPPCEPGSYCDWDDNGGAACGADDRPGVCRPIPEMCYEIYAPVCGCDGQTYSNDCHAAEAGVDVAAAGACAPQGHDEGQMCGGIASFQCREGLACDYRDTICGADIAGVCVVFESTPCTMAWLPVCGCDGTTYGNDCVRRNANVGLAHQGACE